ncbi:unnamed protein product [Cladocopium goreaui]|uniref:Protein kinase domain-containing protein n=1 Tax=Cladocopium goreaui TaxID=2562237 RepID=A0A9P1BZQ4_9DINO|nr:unnamed protein product [Cladocopium goreaui]
MKEFIYVWWPYLFAVATIMLQAVVDPAECIWPPKLELSGQQAALLAKTPVWLCTAGPTLIGPFLLNFMARKRNLSAMDRQSLMWWHVNAWWFHTGCDVFSGLYQIMPVLTELYTHMSPVHVKERWHPEREHLDCAYGLELFVEAPFALWLVYLFMTQDHRRYLIELAALGIQFAGTVVYYLPGIMRLEHACWLSHADRFCGSFWIIWPTYVFIRTLNRARPENGSTSGKKSKQK